MDDMGIKTTKNIDLENKERKKLILLNPREYEHPFDRQALNALEGTPGLEKLVRKIFKHGYERAIRLQYTGSYLKITPDNFPDIYKLLEEACDIIELKNVPELYMEWSYAVNGMAIGSENPIIILTSGAIDLLTPEELLYLIGHECGHIKSGHMLYHTMALVIPFLGDIIGTATLGIGSLVSTGLELALLYWSRMSEFTADRAGLLACQDKDAVISALMKMSGVPKNFYDKMNTEDFIKQAEAFKGFDHDSTDKAFKYIMIMDQTHPWTVMRASEILKWIKAEEYQRIIDKHTGDIESLEISCLKCGSKLKGTDTFCGHCGEKISGRYGGK